MDMCVCDTLTGPVYGFQWRFSGAEYKTCDDVYTGQGIDQLAQVRVCACVHMY
jgi:thymidylate synthase